MSDGLTPEGYLARGEDLARTLFGPERFEQTRVQAEENNRRRLLRLADEIIFGRIYPGGELTLRERSLCTIAALTVLGRADQLKGHIAGARHIGTSQAVIAGVIEQMAFYGGFPAALNAMQIADECFAGEPARPVDASGAQLEGDRRGRG
jgi:alkylhydroperoxidase/carboxymuconolactone decarboxylase family protein YurZ